MCLSTYNTRQQLESCLRFMIHDNVGVINLHLLIIIFKVTLVK